MTFGDIIKSFAAPVAGPVGITWDGKYLWISEDDGSVDVIDRKGTVIKSLTSPIPSSPRDIVQVGNRFFQAEGTTDSAAIWVVDQEFNLIREIAVPGTTARNLQGIGYDGKFIYATEAGGAGQQDIHQFSQDGIHIRDITPPGAGAGTGVEVIGERIFFQEVTNDLIRVLDMDGNQIKSVAAVGPSSRGLAFDGKYLWTVDFTDNLVYQLSLQ